MAILAVVFDLDGTVADTAPDIAASMEHILKKYGRYESLEELVRTCIGNGTTKLFGRIYERLGIPSEAIAADIADYKQYYQSHSYIKTRLYPHTLEVLNSLKKRGLKLAMATMKPREATRTLVEGSGMRDYLDLVIASDDMLRPKPDPWCVQECARKFGLQPDQLAMVGDGMTDVGAAKAAGSLSIAVLGGYFDQQAIQNSGADHIIGDLSEILELL